MVPWKSNFYWVTLHSLLWEFVRPDHWETTRFLPFLHFVISEPVPRIRASGVAAFSEGYFSLRANAIIFQNGSIMKKERRPTSVQFRATIRRRQISVTKTFPQSVLYIDCLRFSPPCINTVPFSTQINKQFLWEGGGASLRDVFAFCIHRCFS